ncbi:MAG: hypothetical protein GY856_46545 [bacterium]|nr:hypothetical protein [bacterium]
MILWIDAQLSPHLAPWITKNFGVEAFSARWLGLRDANDREIFLKARDAGAVVMTKDGDFIRLLNELGPPPKVLWITSGNTSNPNLKQLFGRTLPKAVQLLGRGEDLVEISDAW